MPDFLLPDLGEGLTEGEILTWHIAVGDSITVDQVVVEVETAKAAVEVPVPFAGTVTTLHGEPGDTLRVGMPLLTVATDDAEAAGDPQAGLHEPGVVTEQESAEEGGSGNVLVGYGTTTTPRRRRRGPSNGQRTAAATAATADTSEQRVPPGVISPLVRTLARDSGVDLRRVTGSGPHGIVRRADVEAAATALQHTIGHAATEATEPHEAVTGGEDAVGDHRIPLRGLRKSMADKMTASRREIPEATVWVDADATELVRARRELNEDTSNGRVSLLSLIARFTVAGLRHFPELNSRIDGNDILVRGSVHLGVATQTDRGLLVPVVEDADRLSARGLAAGIAAHAAAGAAGSLQPNQLTGSTFTINNYGVFGVDGSAAIINYPEAGILGIGRIIDRPWVVDGEVTARTLCPLTLAFDHRVCDGGTAGGFLRFVADCIESPMRALAEI